MIDRLIAVAEEYWSDLDGHIAAHGGQPLEDMPLRRFCSVVWWWMTRNADNTETERLREQIWQPPKGMTGEGIWSSESETAALDAAMKQLGI